MQRLVAPLCLLLALAMVFVGFGLLMSGPPEPTAELHQARASGDDSYGDAIEEQLRREQRTRNALLTCLFVGAGVFTVLAFLAIRPAESRGQGS